MPRALLALVVLAAALRFPTLGLQSLWADEGFTWDIANAPLPDLLDRVAETESTPPLHYAITWLWIRLAGDSDVALRFLPALWGTLTVPVVWAAARVHLSERAALFAAALVATAPLLVWYSQEARAYALLVLLCAVAYWCLVSRRHAGWAVASAAALATHYFAIFLVAPMGAWLLWRRRAAWPLVGPALVGAALLPLLKHQSDTVARPWAERYTLLDQVKATTQEFLVGHYWTWIIHRPGFLVMAALWVAGLWVLWRRREHRVLLPLALAGLTLALPTLVSLAGTNYLAPRNVLGAWPLLAIAVGAGMAAHRRGAWLLGAACGLSVAIVAAGWFEPRLQRQDLGAFLDPDPAGSVIVIDDFNHVRVTSRYLRGERRAASGPPGTVTVLGHRVHGEARFTTPPTPDAELLRRDSLGELRMSVWSSPDPVAPPPGDALLVLPGPGG